MTNRGFIVLASLSMFILGFVNLALGFLQMKRKPLLFSTKQQRAGAFFIFLPLMAGSVAKIITDTTTAGSDISLPSLLVMILALLVLYILLIVFITREYKLFNVTDTALFECLEEALQRRGIEYSQEQTPGLFARLYRISQFTITLSGLKSSIKVTTNYPYYGTAQLRFRGKRQIANYTDLVSDLKAALESRRFDKRPITAYLFFFTSVVAIGAGVYMFLALGK